MTKEALPPTWATVRSVAIRTTDGEETVHDHERVAYLSDPNGWFIVRGEDNGRDYTANYPIHNVSEIIIVTDKEEE